MRFIFNLRSNQFSPKNVKGFTLVEVMATAVVAFFLVGGLFMLLSIARTSALKGFITEAAMHVAIADSMEMQKLGYDRLPSVSDSGRRLADGTVRPVVLLRPEFAADIGSRVLLFRYGNKPVAPGEGVSATEVTPGIYGRRVTLVEPVYQDAPLEPMGVRLLPVKKVTSLVFWDTRTIPTSSPNEQFGGGYNFCALIVTYIFQGGGSYAQ
jgi:hypothetical protein